MKLESMGSFFDSRIVGYEEHMLNSIESASDFYPYTASLLPKNADASILDLGCGTGLELDYYFSLNPSAHVTGIDLAPGMLSVLKNKHSDKNFRLICASYLDIPFSETQYDAAVSVESLHHFTADEKAPLYKKLFRSLKHSGYFILTDYFADNISDEKHFREEFLRLRSKQGLPDNEFYHFDTPLTVEHEIEVLVSSGFDKVEILSRWGATCTVKAIKL